MLMKSPTVNVKDETLRRGIGVLNRTEIESVQANHHRYGQLFCKHTFLDYFMPNYTRPSKLGKNNFRGFNLIRISRGKLLKKIEEIID